MLSVNSSFVTVSWDNAFGGFDFHRVTVANTSVTATLTIPKEDRVAMVTGLVDGCSYNVSAERVRGATAGSAAFLTVTIGRGHYRCCTGQHPGIITQPYCLLIKLKTSSFTVYSSPVLHECQPVSKGWRSWKCLHVRSHYAGSRRQGVWIITK